ncbi:MAG: hypothetical protein WBG69_00380 [Arcobacteraceae bacterium]
MFNTNKKQFINILQQNKQLKINYKTIQDDKILKEENSAFLITDDQLPQDAKFKLNTLQKNINHTYIASLFESPNQHIIPTNKVDVISYDSVKIGRDTSIVIPKNEINSIGRYFEETGIDYILSPYTIIEEYLEDNGKKNSLNFLIYNNIIYTIIYNDKKQIAYNKIKVLTPFESTQDETFLEDDIVGQKLYEEVNFLEIQQFLLDTVEDYYTHNADIEFLEHIEILYTLRPLSDDQIKSLKEIMMMPIEYRAISLNDYLDEIVQREDSKIHNFITTRTKKEDKSIYLWIVLAILSVILVVGVFYFKLDSKQMQENITKMDQSLTKPVEKKEPTVEVKKQAQIESVEPAIVSLPNHIQNNSIIIENVKMLFDVVPYNALLKDIEIGKNSSTFVSNFLANSTSLEDMKIKLNNIYNESKVLLEHKNKVITNTIIQNDKLKPQYDFYKKIDMVNYKKYNFLSTSKATAYLIGITIPNSIVKFDLKEKQEYTTYNFTITSKIKSPEEFFAFIEKLKTQQLSIELQYPITFSHTNDYIEAQYKLKIHQQNKKQVQPIK